MAGHGARSSQIFLPDFLHQKKMKRPAFSSTRGGVDDELDLQRPLE